MSKGNVNLKVNTKRIVMLREIPEKGHFIIRRAFVKATSEQAVVYGVMQRTSDPYKSKTLLGTPVRTFPSEKVFVVEVERVEAEVTPFFKRDVP